MFKENNITVPFTQVVVSNRGNEAHEVSKEEKEEAKKLLTEQYIKKEEQK